MREDLRRRPPCVIVKHATPAASPSRDAGRGLPQGVRDRPGVGLRRHHRLQPRRSTRRPPKPCREQFVEVLIAPGFSRRRARSSSRKKANVRVLEIALPEPGAKAARCDFKRVGGGLLVQSPDARDVVAGELRVVTRKAPTAAAARRPAVRLARGQAREVERHRLRGDGQTLGVGAGQMSRVDSARIAATKAKSADPLARGLGGGVRRLLPVPRRPRRGRATPARPRSSSRAAACATTR